MPCSESRNAATEKLAKISLIVRPIIPGCPAVAKAPDSEPKHLQLPNLGLIGEPLGRHLGGLQDTW